MTPSKMRTLIKEFIASSDAGERRVGESLKPMLELPDEEIIDAVRTRLHELERGIFAFSKQWMFINGE